MNILQFLKEFPNAAACEQHFKLQREKEGIKCKKCNGYSHYWLKAKKQWQCSDCKFRTTLRSGTIMESAKLSMHIWYCAMAFISLTKKGMSCNELQVKLGLTRYESTLRLYHKIREAMGNRDNMYILKGMIELDEGYFKIETTAYQKSKTKAGRGSTGVQNVLVMAESTPLEDINGNKSTHCGYFKLKVLQTHLSEEVTNVVSANVDNESIIVSDSSTSYTNFDDIIEAHYTEISSKEVTKSTLKWVHIAIGNARRVLTGIYQKVSKKYLQLYLDEFCYKLNRRHFKDKLFNRLTLAVANNNW
jgi:transposase-like protein